MHLQDNELLNRVVQSAPIGICILDAVTFKAELLNDKFLEIAGKPKEAIIGKWYWEPFAEAREAYEASLKNVAETGEAFHADEAELILVRHDREETVFVTFVYAPVMNAAGEVSVITSWNAAAERIFGYKAEEMIGESIYKLIPEELHFEEPQILERLRAGQRIQHFETKRRTKDGRLIDVSLTISPVKDPRGNIIGLSKIARDITEKKLDENRKNAFIGMVSHELKTPLTSLSAIIQVTNTKLKAGGDSFLMNAMEKANQQVKRMTAMINGFLNISRLESGKIHIEKQPFDIGALIADMIDEASLTARTDLIRFERCPLITVNADRDKIGSVISNLISNAIKYSPLAASVEIACATRDKQVVVSVKDEGMGIKPEDLSKIFDRYYRVEGDQTRHIAGFGIGLYLSSEIIARHGGKVWAESEPGAGSTFYFSLPKGTD